MPHTRSIHVWTLDLDGVTAPDAAITRHLSRDELARAAAFARAVHRRRYLVSHAFLHAVLREHLGDSVIEIGHSEQGKPFLMGDAAGALHFSLSHSGPVAACAVGPRELGVDIECDREIPEADAIASRIFSAAGLTCWRAEPPPSRSASLFAGWTRFEALAKAQGGGMIDPPEPIDHDGTPGRWSGLMNRRSVWSVITVRSGQGTTLSLAIAGGPEPHSVRPWRSRDHHASEPWGPSLWQRPPESATVREP